jgi:RecG-like helicase
MLLLALNGSISVTLLPDAPCGRHNFASALIRVYDTSSRMLNRLAQKIVLHTGLQVFLLCVGIEADRKA